MFVINLPEGLLCLGFTLATVRPSLRDPNRVIDPLGQAAVMVTVAALIAALNEVGRRGLRGPAVIAGVLIVAGQRACSSCASATAPTLRCPDRCWGHDLWWAETAIGLLVNFGFYGMIFAASVYFQQHDGLSAALAGLALLPAVAVTMVGSALSGRLADRLPHQRLMLVGLLTACLGLTLWVVVGQAASYAVLWSPSSRWASAITRSPRSSSSALPPPAPTSAAR